MSDHPAHANVGDREPEFAALSDDDLLALYREQAHGHVHDDLQTELLVRNPSLRAVAARYRMSYRQDVQDAGGHPNVMRLEVVPPSTRTEDIADAYRALWRWIVLEDDEALRARPTITLSEILRRAGIARGSWDGYVSRGHVAGRIGHDWHTGEQVWDRAVVEHWLATRGPSPKR